MTRLVEVRKRGIFGYCFAFLFWGWNILMAWALFSGLAAVGQLGEQAMTEAERAGHNAGVGLGFSAILLLWAVGTVVFGGLMYATRGRRELVQMD